jgi:hypothetical protein
MSGHGEAGSATHRKHLVRLNAQWHQAHKLARSATLEERLEWHLQHAVNCGCREMPASIRQERERRGLLTPAPHSLT